MRNIILSGILLVVITISIFIGRTLMSVEPVKPKSARVAAAVDDTSAVTERASVQPPPPDTPAVVSISPPPPRDNIPHRGSVQVLNGCGITGVADSMAKFLRSKKFDIKDVGNAPSWNYPTTMVIARTRDMSVAKEIDSVLKTGGVTLIRNRRDGELYDVTVVVGSDYAERIRQ